MAAHLYGLRCCVRALAVQHGLLGADAAAEGRRVDDPIHRLGQAYVALDVGQRLQLGRKLLELCQAPLGRLRQPP